MQSLRLPPRRRPGPALATNETREARHTSNRPPQQRSAGGRGGVVQLPPQPPSRPASVRAVAGGHRFPQPPAERHSRPAGADPHLLGQQLHVAVPHRLQRRVGDDEAVRQAALARAAPAAPCAVLRRSRLGESEGGGVAFRGAERVERRSRGSQPRSGSRWRVARRGPPGVRGRERVRAPKATRRPRRAKAWRRTGPQRPLRPPAAVRQHLRPQAPTRSMLPRRRWRLWVGIPAPRGRTRRRTRVRRRRRLQRLGRRRSRVRALARLERTRPGRTAGATS